MSHSAPGTGRPRAETPLQVVLLALVIQMLWGGNLVAVKLGLTAVPPMWSAFWRFTAGTCTLLPWIWWRGVPLWPRASEWPGLLVLSGLFTVQIASMNWGTHLTTAGLATILISTNPLFASLFAHVFVPGDRVSPRRSAGLVLAFAGVCAIFVSQAAGRAAEAPLWGNLLMLTSGALLGGRLVFSQRLLQRIETTRLIFWQGLLALPVFAGSALLLESVRWERLAWQPVAAIAYQGMVIAGLGFMVTATLLRRYRPSVVTSFNFTQPVFGVLLSIVLLGEPFSWSLLAGLIAVALGLLIITTQR